LKQCAGKIKINAEFSLPTRFVLFILNGNTHQDTTYNHRCELSRGETELKRIIEQQKNLKNDNEI
jgi:hypothetical protein